MEPHRRALHDITGSVTKPAAAALSVVHASALSVPAIVGDRYADEANEYKM
jgi:hypothetical protein